MVEFFLVVNVDEEKEGNWVMEVLTQWPVLPRVGEDIFIGGNVGFEVGEISHWIEKNKKIDVDIYCSLEELCRIFLDYSDNCKFRVMRKDKSFLAGLLQEISGEDKDFSSMIRRSES